MIFVTIAFIQIVGVVTPNGTQVSGYGNISKANHTRVDGNTIFNIGSITKTFSAVVLTDMVKQGLVKFDDPLEKYLPSNVTVQSFNIHRLTLEDLVSHTSGLPYWPLGWKWNQHYTTQQVYQFLTNRSLASVPETKDEYSNIGMGILGHALSLETGIPFDQIIKDKILNILGMNSTGDEIQPTFIEPNGHKIPGHEYIGV